MFLIRHGLFVLVLACLQEHEMLKADKKLLAIKLHNLDQAFAESAQHLSHEKDRTEHLKSLVAEKSADDEQHKANLVATQVRSLFWERRQIDHPTPSQKRARLCKKLNT